MKKFLPAAAFFLSLSLLAFVSPVHASFAVVDWSEPYVNVRADSAHGSKKLGAIQKGNRVEILSQRGEWARVHYAGGEGWVLLKALRVVPDPPPAPKPAEPRVVPQETQAAAAPAAPVSPARPVEEPVSPPVSSPAKPAPAGGYLSNVDQRPGGLPEVSIGKTLVSMISGLLLVLGLIAGVVWLLRRFMSGRFPALQGGNAIRLLATRPLAQRQALMLVEVGGEVYLLSQTDSEVRLLTKIDSASAIDRLDSLFTFKPSKFESELRRELDEDYAPAAGAIVDSRASNGTSAPESSADIAERLRRLRGQKTSENP